MLIRAPLARSCRNVGKSSRRMRPHGMTPVEGLTCLLEADFPCGVVRHGDRVVGAWVATEADCGLGGPGVVAAWLARDGIPAATVRLYPSASRLREGIDASRLQPGHADRDAGFGHVVGVMDALAGGHVPAEGSPVARRVGALRQDMARALADGMPRVPGHAGAVAARMAAMGAAVAPFLSTLDPRALALCRERDLFDTLSHAWDGIDASLSPRCPLAEAVSMAPSCARVLAEEWAERRAAIRASGADAGGAALLRDAMASVGAPAAAARHWDSLAAWKAANDDPGETLHPARWALRALAYSATFPVDWLPRDGDWEGYAASAPVLLSACALAAPSRERGAGRGVIPWLGHAVASGGRWAEWHAGIAAEAGRDPASAVRDVADMARALTRQVVEPARALGGARRTDGYRTAFGALFSGRGIRHAVAMSRDWHAALGRMDAAMARFPGHVRSGGGWPAVLPDLDHEVTRLVVLDTPGALRDEGGAGPDAEGRLGLRHCVADYARECRRGAYRVASIRRVAPDGSWSRLSTVGFVLLGGRPTVEQHSGHANSDPHPDARYMVHKYLQHLTVAGMAAGVSWPALPDGDAGVTWADPDAWEAVARLWDPHLPRALRGMDAAAWRALPDPAPGDPAWPHVPFRRPGLTT